MQIEPRTREGKMTNVIQTEWDIKQPAYLLAARYLRNVGARNQIEFGQESHEELTALIAAIRGAWRGEVEMLRNEIAQLEAVLDAQAVRVDQESLLLGRYGTPYPRTARDWWGQ